MDNAIRSILNEREIDILYKEVICTFLGNLIKFSKKYPELYDVINDYCKQNPGKINKIILIESPLRIATLDNNINAVKILCQNKANVNNNGDNISWPALLIAAKLGYIDIVKILCKNGANTNYCSEANYYALLLAANSGYTGVVKFLLEYDAVPFLTFSKHNFSDIINNIALLNTLS